MRKTIDELEAEAKEAIDKSPTGRLKLGFDYVITAEKPADTCDPDDPTEDMSKLTIEK